MKYPLLKINLVKLEHNVRVILKWCKQYQLQVYGVTKVTLGDVRIAEVFMKAGLDGLADSRIDNLIKFQHLPIQKMMLRLPMLHQVEDVVRFTDVSLNSEIKTLLALNEAAIKLNKVHDIILMADMGDLREGFFEQEELDEAIEVIENCSNLRCIGVGTNLSCYGGLIPTYEILQRLVDIQQETVKKLPYCTTISGGNSSTLHLMLTQNKLPPINQVRLGESLFLGIEAAFGQRIPDTHDDVCILQAQIIEVKVKPSAPQGEIGRNAFGHLPKYVDVGHRKVIICAIGLQDTDLMMSCLDQNLRILGASSDHLLLESFNGKDYEVGDIIDFKCSYGSLLRLFGSPYVQKEYLENKITIKG